MTGKVEDRPLRESATLVFLAAIAMVRRSPCSVAIRRRAEEFWKAADRLCGALYAALWVDVTLYVYHGYQCPTAGVWCGGTSIEERAL